MRELVDNTPKDTGYAAANWIPSVGSYSSRPVGEPSSPGPAESAQSLGETEVSRFTLEKGKIFIVNNARYIGQIVSPVAVVTAINQAVAKIRFR